MIFYFVSVIVPILVYFLTPEIIKYITGKKPREYGLLAVAVFLFFIAWYLPSPTVQGQQTAFVTHFIGGGIFSGLLWLYIYKHVGWKLSLFQSLLAIYTLVSAFGVANELFEFFTVQVGLASLNPSDTWWDLVANTSGAFAVWCAYSLFVMAKRRP